MTNHQGDESTLTLDFDIANSAQTEYCSTFHFPSVPPWPLGPLGPMDHMDNLDILHHLDHSHRSNHFDNPDWSMINQEDNCRIRIVYLVLFDYFSIIFLIILPEKCGLWFRSLFWYRRRNLLLKPHLLSPKLTLEPPLPALLSPTSCPGISPPAILLFLFCNQEPEKQIAVKSGEYDVVSDSVHKACPLC